MSNYQWEKDDDDYTPYHLAYSNNDSDSSDHSHASVNSASDFREETSSESSNSSDDDFEDYGSKKSKPKSKQSTSRQAVSRSSSKKNVKQQYSSEERKPKRHINSDEDYDYSESYSDAFEDGIAYGDRPKRRQTSSYHFNETETEDDDDSSSNEEEGYEKPEKEEPSEQVPTIERVIGTEIEKKGEKRQYFCKYKNQSYIHCKWLTHEELNEINNGPDQLKKWKNAKKKSDVYLESAEESVNNLQILIGKRNSDDIINPEYFEVIRIIAHEIDPETNEDRYLVQWSASQQQDEEFTWELKNEISNDAALKAYEEREMKYEEVRNAIPPDPDELQQPQNYIEYSEENHNIPMFKNGLELRDYQLDGLNWLRKKWYERQSAILGDEMGLGKTVQGVSIINELFKLGLRGPFLIVVPKSTLMQWKREFRAWTDLNVVYYSDSKKARPLINDYELYWRTPDNQIDTHFTKFEVLLVNYEKLMRPDVNEIVNRFTWEYVIADEAHKLKKPNTETYKIFSSLLDQHKIKYLLLMTGTPPQVPSEMWGLLHLIAPRRFDDQEEFHERYDGRENDSELKDIIAPYMLQRFKKNVEKTIGSKEEIIVEIELSTSQRNLYKETLRTNAMKSDASSNMKMDLRKVCNHPYLLISPKRSQDSLIDPSERSNDPLQQQIECCGKMMFADKLLSQLYQQKSKVLIFSQLTQILDIFEDYCSYRKYKFARIDGQVRGSKRQFAMDNFNDPNKDIFIFLLCTKAGGQGLNLTAANYVIIYDSDWNPDNDIQAQARCHRIGQKNKVEVFRLVSKGTYETQMLKKSLEKIQNDQLNLYKIAFDKETRNLPIPQLLTNRIPIHSKEELELYLESEKTEGDIDNPLFFKQLQREQEIRETSERRTRKRRQASSEDDDIVDNEYQDDFNPNQLRKALLNFGWGQWDKILEFTKHEFTKAQIENFSTVLIYAMFFPNPKVIEENKLDDFYQLTGITDLDSEQNKLLKKLMRKHKLHDLLKYAERDIRQLFELKFVYEFLNSQSSMPPIEIPRDSIKWSNTEDWDIFNAIRDYGYNNWKKISEEIINQKDLKQSVEEVKKFLKNRFHHILSHIDGYQEFASRFNLSHRSKSRSSDRHRHRSGGDHKNKPKQEEKIQDPRVAKLELLSKAICLFGHPNNEDTWAQFEQYCSADNDEYLDDVRYLIDAAHRLLSSKTQDPETVFDDEKELIFMTKTLANEIAVACKWFEAFRSFYPTQFNSDRLNTIDSHPDWWDHSFDPILFEHINLFGFSRPYTLLSRSPFLRRLPSSSVDRVLQYAQYEDQNNHTTYQQPDLNPFELFVQKNELKKQIDLIINDLSNETIQQLSISIPKKQIAKFELPKILSNVYIMSLGNGDFCAIDGYLYRSGFECKVKHGGSEYKCLVTQTSYMPFQITQNQRKYTAETPLKAWEQVLDKCDQNPFDLFGLGLPWVRYFYQQQLNGKRVSGYRSINFDIVEEKPKNGLQSDLAKKEKTQLKFPSRRPMIRPMFLRPK